MARVDNTGGAAFNVDNGTHFLSASTLERDSVINNLDAYNFEGVGFKSADPDSVSAETVFRFFKVFQVSIAMS